MGWRRCRRRRRSRRVRDTCAPSARGGRPRGAWSYLWPVISGARSRWRRTVPRSYRPLGIFSPICGTVVTLSLDAPTINLLLLRPPLLLSPSSLAPHCRRRRSRTPHSSVSSALLSSSSQLSGGALHYSQYQRRRRRRRCRHRSCLPPALLGAAAAGDHLKLADGDKIGKMFSQLIF